MKPGIKIVNKTGIGGDTEIIRTDTGEDLTEILGVKKVELLLEVNRVVSVIITCNMPALDINSGDLSMLAMNPVTKKYERVTAVKFESGNYIDFDGLLRIGP